jgi:CheY-like chemotaxis protein
MVLDDESSQVDAIRRSLRKTKCRVIGSVDPLDFLDLLRSHIPDLIILDVMMPGIDGWEVFRRLREIPSFDITPVVFLTALATAEEEYHFSPGVGHCRVLAKPIAVDRLVSAMVDLLSMATPFQNSSPKRLSSAAR